jgi:CheY-like chemotaxis protein
MLQGFDDSRGHEQISRDSPHGEFIFSKMSGPLSPRPHPPRGLKVLLVEDDANDVELLRLAFKSAWGPSPDIAFNGREAVQAIHTQAKQENLPDLILCDLNMPVMNGFEFLKWLKQESPCPHTPLVVLTSSVIDSDVAQAYRMGAAAYLVKPSSHEALIVVAKALVDFWRLVHSSPGGRED